MLHAQSWRRRTLAARGGNLTRSSSCHTGTSRCHPRELRRVSSAGTFRLHNGQQFLTQALNGEMIGLEEVHERVWNVLYYDTLLGRFDERTRTITGAPSLKKDC